MTNNANTVSRNYSFIKGRIAEAIVERLFITLGMMPVHNGYEIKNPDLAHLRRTGQLPKNSINKIEYGCDFIVRSLEKNAKGYFDVYQIEVKYSQKGEINLEKIEYYDNKDLIFIFLDPKNFWCATYDEIQEKKTSSGRLSFESLYELSNHPVFNFSKKNQNIIIQFKAFIHSALRDMKSKDQISKQIDSLKKQSSVLTRNFKRATSK